MTGVLNKRQKRKCRDTGRRACDRRQRPGGGGRLGGRLQAWRCLGHQDLQEAGKTLLWNPRRSMISGEGLLVYPDLRLLAPDPESTLQLFQTPPPPQLMQIYYSSWETHTPSLLTWASNYYPHYNISEMLKNSVLLLENKIYGKSVKSTISTGRK